LKNLSSENINNQDLRFFPAHNAITIAWYKVISDCRFFEITSDQSDNRAQVLRLLPKSFPSCTANNIRRQRRRRRRPSCTGRRTVSGVFNKPANAASKRIYDHVVQSVPRGIMGSS